MAMFYTEDQVRDSAGQILELRSDNGVVSGVGQLTTFNQLGFKGKNKKPDGWYLPKDCACKLPAKQVSRDKITGRCEPSFQVG